MATYRVPALPVPDVRFAAKGITGLVMAGPMPTATEESPPAGFVSHVDDHHAGRRPSRTRSMGTLDRPTSNEQLPPTIPGISRAASFSSGRLGCLLVRSACASSPLLRLGGLGRGTSDLATPVRAVTKSKVDDPPYKRKHTD